MPQVRYYTVTAVIEFKIGGIPLTHADAVALAEERLASAVTADAGSPTRTIRSAKIASLASKEGHIGS